MTDKHLVVVGLGYVGLPLAVLAAEQGFAVTGIDIDADKVAKITAGECPLEDAELARNLKQYPITATTDWSAAAAASVIVVAVPTPVSDDHQPDLGPLRGALSGIAPHLRAGQTVIIESTINPGVMDEAVVPLLRDQAPIPPDSDSADNCVYLAHCPERINPGDPKWTVRNIPRVLGGYTPAGTQRAQEFYESLLDAPVTIMQSVTEAEAVKILENTFRDINIAFINEMAQSFAKLDIDIMHVIAGAATKPFAFMPHYPGNGVGGHCISVDPYYMIERARTVGFDHKFLQLARDINNSMPAYTVSLLETGLAAVNKKLSGSTVALLGLAYKRNIDDLRESPAVTIQHLLEGAVADLRVFDPHASAASTVSDIKTALAGADAIIIGTDHDEFTRNLTPEQLKQAHISVFIDGKNAFDGPAFAAAGIHYLGIGRRYEPAA